MTYILILMMFGTGKSITTVEMKSKQSCEQALEDLKDYTKGMLGAVCVKK